MNKYQSFVREIILTGYDQLLENYVELMIALDSDLAKKYIESTNGKVLIDPHLILKFIYDPIPELELKQLLFGFLTNDFKPHRLNILTNKEGIAYLPNYGDLITDFKSSQLNMVFDARKSRILLSINNKNVPYQFRPIKRLKEIDCELLTQFDPYLRNKFGYDRSSNSFDNDIYLTAKKYSDCLDNALKLIRKHSPWFFELLQIVMRKFFIHNIGGFYSCASISTPGISFIKVKDLDNEVFFVEEIAHQCSHNLLYAGIHNGQSCFNVNVKETKMSAVNGNQNDSRNVFGAFHSLFTLTNITQIFKYLLNDKSIDARQRHEVMGRFADNMKRLRTSIGEFQDIKRILTDRGVSILEVCNEVFNCTNEEFHGIISTSDTSNQPYVFSFTKFLELNPLDDKQS